MKNLLKPLRSSQGFTLIELLIVIAILGIIAAIVIPNAAGFMVAGKLNAANSEAANVKTAATGFMAEHEGNWPDSSTELTNYLSGSLKGTYNFDDNGWITSADPGTWGTQIEWNDAKQVWERATP